MAYNYCGLETTNLGTFINTDVYKGSDGRVYRVANRTTVTIPKLNFSSAPDLPYIWIDWISGGRNDHFQAHGVVLDASGAEVISFYNGTLSDQPLPGGISASPSTKNYYYYSVTEKTSLPAGDYEIITFEIWSFGSSQNKYSQDTAGRVQICLAGTPVTPVPTATFVPTPTPTVTPLPTAVTPTPTATPIPTGTPIPSNPVPEPLIPIGPQYTLTYSGNSKGWPSFYSYNPDFMIGMNNYFYSFAGGNLWRHNTNELRNSFYGQQYNSRMVSVINERPLVSKLFKTINLQSDEPWSVNLNTDLQFNGFISSTWFELKEGSWFASIKNTTQSPTLISNFASRSINGIGRCIQYSGLPSTRQFDFSVNPVFNIGSILSVGDYLYYNNEISNSPNLTGQVTAINIDLSNNINNIIVDSTINGATSPITVDPYLIGVKNDTAESYGLLGHFCRFVIENVGPSPTELFAVQAEIMKSYP